jgi:hypothetical protein
MAEFYKPLLREARHLTMQSAFVRSGALWSPFPLVVSMLVLIFIGVFIFVFLRNAGTVSNLVPIRRLLKSAVWALGATAVSTVLALFVTFLFEMIVYAPTEVLLETAKAAATHQSEIDEQNMPKPEPRRLGYQEARILIPTIFEFPRPCTFRVIAPTEALNLRGDLVTLTQTSNRNISQCELIEESKDRDPDAFEDKLDYPDRSIVVHAKPMWTSQEDDLVMCLRQMGFWKVIHGKDLSPTDTLDIEVVFGTGKLW